MQAMNRSTPIYHVEFRTPVGERFRLDTIDPGKIGPWIAEMFGINPWHPSWGPQSPVTITTGELVTG